MAIPMRCVLCCVLGLLIPVCLVGYPAAGAELGAVGYAGDTPSDGQPAGASDRLPDGDDGTESTSPSLVGKPVAVTLYREGALVTREIVIPANYAGDQIIIADLPERVDPSSVFAETVEGLEIRAIRVVPSPLDGPQRDEVRHLQQQLELLNVEMQRLQSQQPVIEQNRQMLDQMVRFTSDTASRDLNHGALEAATVSELFQFATEQREQLATKQMELALEQQRVRRESDLMQRQLANLTQRQGRTSYLARVYFERTSDTPVTMRISYRVSDCHWAPQYSVHGVLDSDEFRIRYSALVQQMSGENWENVQLTLSTASPSSSAMGPTLTPLRVSAISGGGATNQMASPGSSMMGDYSSAKGRALEIRAEQYAVENSFDASPEPADRDIQLNTLAGELQAMELREAAQVAMELAGDANDPVAAQTYELAGTVSLDSRRDQQLVEIADARFHGELYHVAIPLLSSFAYREVELKNTLPTMLLGGEAAVYLDNRFVGNTVLPTTASGQTVVIGFGADGQVRTRRELLDKQETVQGGNQRLQFTYRLVAANFKDTEVKLRILDRLPLAERSNQVTVTLGDLSTPLSDDKLYLRAQRPLGLLRWDVAVPPASFGSDAFDVNYSFTTEFARDLVLSIPDPEEQATSELFNRSGGRQPLGGSGMGMGGMIGK